jgi:trimeric autotransporter adhesin
MLLAVTAHITLPLALQAQSCQPFWAGTGTSSGAGYDPDSPGTLVVFDDGSGPRLYAGGRLFANHGGLATIARWDGRRWEILSSGLPISTEIVVLMVLDDGTGQRLYAVTQFSSLRHHVRWNGISWEPAPPAWFADGHHAMVSFDDGTGLALYGTRNFFPNGLDGNVVRWNGSGWDDVGPRFNRPPGLFYVHDDGHGRRLYVAGTFTSIGGSPYPGIARLNGNTWEFIGGAFNRPRQMISFNDGSGPGLCVINAGSMYILCWRGGFWSPIPAAFTGPPFQILNLFRLGVYDDGYGEALYVYGIFTHVNGILVNRIARWDGQTWSPLGHGIRSVVDMTVFDDGRGPSLFMAGFDVNPGGALARGVVQWVGCHNQCYADCDNSLTHPRLNVEDFSCFINKFAIDDPYADCNQDGQRTIADFACFIQRFNENCR